MIEPAFGTSSRLGPSAAGLNARSSLTVFMRTTAPLIRYSSAATRPLIGMVDDPATTNARARAPSSRRPARRGRAPHTPHDRAGDGLWVRRDPATPM